MLRATSDHQIEAAEHDALLEQVCPAPGCYLPNGDHAAEETTACLERWLTTLCDREAKQ